MDERMRVSKLPICIPQSKEKYRPVERLMALAGKRHRSVNYLVVGAIMHYLEREESRE